MVLVLLVVACDDGAKKEAERLRAELEAVKAERREQQVREQQVREQQKAERREQQKRRTTINEFMELKEAQKHAWRIEPGRYRVRVTSGGAGVKVKWAGAACAASGGEVKVYDVVCDVAADAQLLVENPGGLTRSGPTESVTVLATPM